MTGIGTRLIPYPNVSKRALAAIHRKKLLAISIAKKIITLQTKKTIRINIYDPLGTLGSTGCFPWVWSHSEIWIE
jgi:hypothetical protein